MIFKIVTRYVFVFLFSFSLFAAQQDGSFESLLSQLDELQDEIFDKVADNFSLRYIYSLSYDLLRNYPSSYPAQHKIITHALSKVQNKYRSHLGGLQEKIKKFSFAINESNHLQVCALIESSQAQPINPSLLSLPRTNVVCSRFISVTEQTPFKKELVTDIALNQGGELFSLYAHNQAYLSTSSKSFVYYMQARDLNFNQVYIQPQSQKQVRTFLDYDDYDEGEDFLVLDPEGRKSPTFKNIEKVERKGNTICALEKTNNTKELSCLITLSDNISGGEQGKYRISGEVVDFSLLEDNGNLYVFFVLSNNTIQYKTWPLNAYNQKKAPRISYPDALHSNTLIRPSNKIKKIVSGRKNICLLMSQEEDQASSAFEAVECYSVINPFLNLNSFNPIDLSKYKIEFSQNKWHENDIQDIALSSRDILSIFASTPNKKNSYAKFYNFSSSMRSNDQYTYQYRELSISNSNLLEPTFVEVPQCKHSWSAPENRFSCCALTTNEKIACIDYGRNQTEDKDINFLILFGLMHPPLSFKVPNNPEPAAQGVEAASSSLSAPFVARRLVFPLQESTNNILDAASSSNSLREFFPSAFSSDFWND